MEILASLADVVSQMGALGIAIIGIWALMTERVVPKGRLDDCQRERDELMHKVDRLTDAAIRRQT